MCKRRRAAHGFHSLPIVGGGFVTGIVMHPRVPGLWYARTDVGGAYRWDSERERWTAITDWIGGDDWRYTGIESVAVDRGDPSAVYLAAGIYNQKKLGNGAMLRSGDQGRTWKVTPMPFGMGGNEAGRGSGERLAVDPHESRIVFFGSRDAGLWRSDDGAETWSKVEAFPDIETALPNPTPGTWNYLTQAVGIVFVLFDPNSAAPGRATPVIYAGVSTRETSLYRSCDAGNSWQPVPDQPVGLRPIRAALGSNGMLYVTYGSEPGPNTMPDGAVWKLDARTDAWANITPEAPDPGTGNPFGYAGIAVDASNPAIVMVATACRSARRSGGDEIFRSLDAGATWTAVGQRGERDSSLAPWLAFGAPQAHVGHWMYALAIDPFDPDRALYGTGQTIWGSTNLARVDRGERPHWRVRASGIEETVVLSLASPSEGAELLAGTGDISGFAVFDVEDPSQSLQFRDPAFQNTTGLDFAALRPSLVVRVGNPGWNRKRDVDSGAYSMDGGRSWTPFSAYPPHDLRQGSVAVSADGATWVWTRRALAPFFTTDRGATWRASRGLGTGDWAIFADRVDASLFYAFERAEGLVFVSRDVGAAFRAGGALPSEPFGSACAVPGRAGHVWLSLGGALYRSLDRGTSFREVRTLDTVTHLAVGKSRTPRGYPTLFAVGRRDGVHGLYRSTDEGRRWRRINDDSQRFGQVRVIAGDPKRFDRVYVGTGGRGVLYGDSRPRTY